MSRQAPDGILLLSPMARMIEQMTDEEFNKLILELTQGPRNQNKETTHDHIDRSPAPRH